jgi:outer membrane protein TolC
MEQKATYMKGSYGSLKPLQEKIYAQRIDVKAQKEKLYPALYAHGSYVFSSAKAYNNNKDINEKYGNVGVVLNIPLLDLHQYNSVDLAKVELQSSEVELQKLQDELQAEANMLENSLPLLENSYKLYKESVADKEKLLKIAKISYESGRMSTEEYLRYEDAVVETKAKLYQTKAQKWQSLMQLAVIYANSIEEMVQ